MKRNIQYVENNGTAYTLMVYQDSHASLERVGFNNGLTLFCVFTSGFAYCHYDRFKVEKELPGNAYWVTDVFKEMQEELIGH